MLGGPVHTYVWGGGNVQCCCSGRVECWGDLCIRMYVERGGDVWSAGGTCAYVCMWRGGETCGVLGGPVHTYVCGEGGGGHVECWGDLCIRMYVERGGGGRVECWGDLCIRMYGEGGGGGGGGDVQCCCSGLVEGMLGEMYNAKFH